MTYIFVMLNFITGGAQTVFYNIASTCNKNIVLIPVFEEYDEKLLKKLPDNVTLINTGIKTNSLMTSYKDFPKIVKEAFKIKKMLKKHSPYVAINFNDNFASLLFTYILSGKDAITWLHCRPQTLLMSRTKKLYLSLMNRFDKIVFICKSQMNLFYRVEGTSKVTNPERVVCTNYLNLDEILKKNQEDLEYHGKFFFSAARLDESSKDFETLLKAYGSLPIEVKNDYKMIIAGEGPDRKSVESRIRSLKLEDHVILLGNIENPNKWMSKSTLYIHSSKHEGYPMVLLEALACQANVISSNCEVGPAEILGDGKFGELFAVGNVNELRDCILKALNKDRKTCGIVSYQRAIELNNLGRKQIKQFFDSIENSSLSAL